MRVRAERGSALALVPAGFLVLVVLAAITVDSAVAYLGQRHLDDAITSAANDAAVAGLSDRSFYASGAVTLDAAATEGVVCRSLAALGSQGLRQLSIEVGVRGAEVEIVATARILAVFGRALPGGGARTVRAAVTANAETRLTAPPAGDLPLTPLACPS